MDGRQVREKNGFEAWHGTGCTILKQTYVKFQGLTILITQEFG